MKSGSCILILNTDGFNTLGVLIIANHYYREDISSVAKRLRKARKGAGYNTPAAAFLRHGWDSMTYLQHEDGLREFDDNSAEIYAKVFGVTKEWLLTGK